VQSLERTFHRCFLPSFGSFGQAVSEEIKMWKVNRWQMTDAKSPHCLWQGELKRILKCEYLHVMYSINMLHYISISFLYKDCSFHPDPLTNMATTGNSCFWLVRF
jgi:hypothetical protein